jgi:2,4-dienoyl-CoA reductase-like NADH-dependent reductase (Old Yellow Enzyme family)
MEMRDAESDAELLGAPLTLPCGVVLKNRLVKAAMSDSLGDGAGDPTDQQIELYRRWAMGGTSLSIIGEVQVDHRYPEKPGNLVLSPGSDDALLQRLAAAGSESGAQIWPQLGHAGALADDRISRPGGPSALDIEGLRCDELTLAEVKALPTVYARAARRARDVGFGGVEIHAGHGFLLGQFLSPLFNHRSDLYGGPIESRTRLLLDIVAHVRAEVDSDFPIAVKINSSDQLEGGLSEDDALVAISLLGGAGVDLIDISGGTYFPGAPSSSDRRTSGPYFVDFARRARTVTDTPLMVTGGFKSRTEAAAAVAAGAADFVGLARTMVLDPDVAANWLQPHGGDPQFPSFESPPPGGITAWFTMRLTALASGGEGTFRLTLAEAIEAYESRDQERIATWMQTFDTNAQGPTPVE